MGAVQVVLEIPCSEYATRDLDAGNSAIQVALLRLQYARLPGLSICAYYVRDVDVLVRNLEPSQLPRASRAPRDRDYANSSRKNSV